MRDADLAMYAAKAQGKGRWTRLRATSMHIAAEERLQLKADLAHALAAATQLELAYQPVVDLEGDEIVGLEALLRWNHPTRGQVPPASSSRSPRRPARSSPIGRWVLARGLPPGRAVARGPAPPGSGSASTCRPASSPAAGTSSPRSARALEQTGPAGAAAGAGGHREHS